MTPPRYLSASPLHSFASRPDVVPRYVSFVETASAVWSWLTGKRPSFREQVRDAQLVADLAEVIAAEMEAEAEAKQGKG